MSDADNDRLQREESFWNAPRLFALGFVFLGACVVLIYVMASI